jgi:hypothetical protein
MKKKGKKKEGKQDDVNFFLPSISHKNSWQAQSCVSKDRINTDEIMQRAPS